MNINASKKRHCHAIFKVSLYKLNDGTPKNNSIVLLPNSMLLPRNLFAVMTVATDRNDGNELKLNLKQLTIFFSRSENVF